MICLKNRTFAVSQTTELAVRNEKELLWFAWKIVLLQYRKQQQKSDNRSCLCCDLLEKSYFCSIANNSTWTCNAFCQLWFAWKIVLLQYRKQPAVIRRRAQVCCDLLEKSYFCSIANNPCRRMPTLGIVVICLKNRTFAVSQTTWDKK